MNGKAEVALPSGTHIPPHITPHITRSAEHRGGLWEVAPYAGVMAA
ncbi:hypothetical protein [Streptomyces capitiformicae]|nr:hypothetical protein [Streptomyces capitiformicae]